MSYDTPPRRQSYNNQNRYNRDYNAEAPRTESKEIFTRNMFHAAVLLQCGASFKYFKKQGRFFYIYLDTTFFDKRSLAKKFEALVDDLNERKSIRDILHNSILSEIEHANYKLRNQISMLIKNDRAGVASIESIDDDDDDDFDDEDDEGDDDDYDDESPLPSLAPKK